MSERLTVKRGSSNHLDAHEAVSEVVDAVKQPHAKIVLFFCSPHYDLEIIARELDRAFDCPIIGCTSAGEITSEMGYCDQHLIALSLSSRELIVHPRLIAPLDQFDHAAMTLFADELQDSLQLSSEFDPKTSFGVLLIDGMSMLEERIIASIYGVTNMLPIVGGSAADQMEFRETFVYWNGRFIQNAAIYVLFETTLPFELFQTQHFEPSEERLIITESDCDARVVQEINGLPAAEVYAEIVGVERPALNPDVFARHPLMLKVGDSYYVRAIQRVNPEDDSMSFYCAIDNGLILRVGRPQGLIEKLRQHMEGLRRRIPSAQVIIGFDCLHRRLEIEHKGVFEEANRAIDGLSFFGFSTYGEQFNGIHMNLTLTGVALGG